MLRDIRELDGEEYADELARRWGGLLSYRYIGRKSTMNVGVTDQSIDLRHDMRNPTGGLLIAPLAIAAPEPGGMTDLNAVPNPVIHSCQILDPGRDVKRIEVLSTTLKTGRQMGYSRSRIVDADNHDRVLAMTEGQAARIGTPPEGLPLMNPDPIEVVDSPDLPPLWEVFGGRKRDDGSWAIRELELMFASPDAALHLGPQHVVLETAAMDLAAQSTGSVHLQAVSSHVMFLSRGKVGPFRVDGEAFEGTAGAVGAQVVMYDEGAQNRPVSSGSYLFRREG